MFYLNTVFFLPSQKNKNKKKGKDEKYGSELTTPENSSSPGMMDMHGWLRNLYVTNSTLNLFPVLLVVRIQLKAKSQQAFIKRS